MKSLKRTQMAKKEQYMFKSTWLLDAVHKNFLILLFNFLCSSMIWFITFSKSRYNFYCHPELIKALNEVEKHKKSAILQKYIHIFLPKPSSLLWRVSVELLIIPRARSGRESKPFISAYWSKPWSIRVITAFLKCNI